MVHVSQWRQRKLGARSFTRLTKQLLIAPGAKPVASTAAGVCGLGWGHQPLAPTLKSGSKPVSASRRRNWSSMAEAGT
jgi:hypothetical protein